MATYQIQGFFRISLYDSAKGEQFEITRDRISGHNILRGGYKGKTGGSAPAVQNAVKEQTKSATLVGLSKEVEKGKTLYEVETKVNGMTRDLMLDKSGAVVSVEEEVALDSIPAPAKAAIQKQAIGGIIEKVEKLTEGSKVSYEATLKNKSGKKKETNVNADGSTHK